MKQLKGMSNPNLFLSFLCFFFFTSFTSSISFNNTRRCSVEQSHVLFMFKQSLFSTNYRYIYDCYILLGSSYYPIMENWEIDTDCCNWNGVTCNQLTGDVIGLNLSCGMLEGTINPNITLFKLPHLQRLNLAFNYFDYSQLPRAIGSLSSSLTHLNISGCGLIGEIPSELSLLSKLVSLDLSGNFFDVPMQSYFLNSLLQNYTLLRDLRLEGVKISLVLPTYLNISSSLKLLDLRFTGLHGKLPYNIFCLQYLEELDLSRNTFVIGPLLKVNTSASIPLKRLSLSGNAGLSGEIFNSIAHLKYLNYLDLSKSTLLGEIPHSVGHLKSLNFLDVSYNNLSGEIPNSIGHLKSLNTFLLTSCHLAGPFPKSLVNLPRLTTLDLSENMFNGMLPSWLFTFSTLENLNLRSNLFSGTLPSEMFNHQSLKKLYLDGNQFVGTIDVLDQDSISQQFLQLVNLTDLYVSYNNFDGVWELDTLLSSLTNLVSLDLSYSGLSVTTNNATRYVNPEFSFLGLASCKLKVFPESLLAMKKIWWLDLSANEIHGRIPNWAGEIGENELTHLNISYNFITGLPQFRWNEISQLYLQSNKIQGPFPPSICNPNNLLSLDLSKNNFGGVIPQCFGSMSYLFMANLGYNYFNGTIPNTFKDCGLLEGIILNGNLLEGEMPRSLSRCRNLKVLDLGNNMLNGTFPDWLGDLPFLQVLDLKSNNFQGSINTSSTRKVSFRSLQVLDLSHNGFVGHLPRKYFQSFKSMTSAVKSSGEVKYLDIGSMYYSIIVTVKGVEQNMPQIFVDYTIVDLSNNKFEGNIPDVIGNLTSLIVLNLSNNNLTGPIPNVLGNILEIESLDLSCNQLTGEIPQSLATLTFLEFLNLSRNHLVGRIPKGTQFSTFDASFGGNPGLCGFPLANQCERKSNPQLEVVEDDESGFTWKVVILGYGCGAVVGLAIVCLMLSMGRPKRLIAIVSAGENMIQRRLYMRRYIYIGK